MQPKREWHGFSEPDKEKRKHGALWYVGWGLIAYIASSLPAAAIAEWAVNEKGMPESIVFVVGVFYLPIFAIINALGLEDQLAAISEAMQRFLP